MLALAIAIGGQALHHSKDHGKHVLRNGLPIGTCGACHDGAPGHDARGGIFVVACRVELKKAQVLRGFEARGRQVADDDVCCGDLLIGHDVTVHKRNGVGRYCCAQALALGLIDGQQAKYVHGGPSKRSMCQKVDRFNVTHVAVSDTDANAAAAPRPD